MAHKTIVIETPEDMVLQAWLAAELVHLHGPQEVDSGPPPPPHPNEIATRAAEAAGLYDDPQPTPVKAPRKRTTK